MVLHYKILKLLVNKILNLINYLIHFCQAPINDEITPKNPATYPGTILSPVKK